MRKTLIFTATILSFLLLTTAAVYAYTNPHGFSLPDNAVKVSNDMYYLGKARDPQSGKMVEGYAIVRRKDLPAKPPWAGGGNGGNGGSTDTSSCYGFLSKGAKWKAVEPWEINSTNSELGSTFALTNTAANIQKWEDAGNASILGDGISTTQTLSADTSSPDGQNEVYFDTVTDSNTIAVTTVWGIFSGPPQTRELVEWDQVFNTDYLWSQNATGSNTEMDYNNISTHELGHAVGLADLYTSDCSEQTMYGYASNGETKKQTLESGDINGVTKLYK